MFCSDVAGTTRSTGAAGTTFSEGGTGNDRLYGGTGKRRARRRASATTAFMHVTAVRDTVNGGPGFDEAWVDRLDVAQNVERVHRRIATACARQRTSVAAPDTGAGFKLAVVIPALNEADERRRGRRGRPTPDPARRARSR